jgi:hypothetical protein
MVLTIKCRHFIAMVGMPTCIDPQGSVSSLAIPSLEEINTLPDLIP